MVRSSSIDPPPGSPGAPAVVMPAAPTWDTSGSPAAWILGNSYAPFYGGTTLWAEWQDSVAGARDIEAYYPEYRQGEDDIWHALPPVRPPMHQAQLYGLVPGVETSFRVAARDYHGNYSAYSDIVTVTTATGGDVALYFYLPAGMTDIDTDDPITGAMDRAATFTTEVRYPPGDTTGVIYYLNGTPTSLPIVAGPGDGVGVGPATSAVVASPGLAITLTGLT